MSDTERLSEGWRLKKMYKALRSDFGGYRIDAARISGETIVMATQNGYLDVVQWLYTEFRIEPTINLFWYYDHKQKKTPSAIDAAAANGYLEILIYLHEVGGMAANITKQDPRRKHRSQFFGLCRIPHVPACLVQPEDLPKPGCTTLAMNAAAGFGYLDVVRWLHNNRTEGCTTDAMDFAAQMDHLEVVQWLRHNRTEGCTTNALDNAASCGHLLVVKWLHQYRSEGCTIKAMDGAASGGHMHVVQWLQQNRTEGCSSAATDGAAACGALDVLKWLHQHRSEGCTTAAIAKAARNGYWRVILWLQENGREKCTTAAMDKAAKAGHFEALIFLHRKLEEGCTRAATREYVVDSEIRRWLLQHYPEDELDDDVSDDDASD